MTRAPDRERVFESDSTGTTTALGEALGRVLGDGHFVGLIGELGAGKTHFVRGVADGAGVPRSEVASPSFAIVYPYQGRITLHHADLYRLADRDELYATGFYDLVGGEGAVLVEWLDKVPGAAPAELLRIEIEIVDEDRRRLRARAYGAAHAALLKAWESELARAG